MSDFIANIHKELYEVSRAGDCARVRELLKDGADPVRYKDEKHGATALHEAALNGHNEMVKTLIQAKCDLNVKNKYEITALHLAAWNGHNDVVKTLIQAKCDLDVKNKYGNTPLLNAATFGHNEVVKILIQAKCNVHVKDDNFGKNALDWAAEKGHNEVVTTLIQANCDVNVKDENNDTLSTFYKDWVSLVISQGQYDVVWKFLEKLPSSQEKGEICI